MCPSQKGTDVEAQIERIIAGTSIGSPGFSNPLHRDRVNEYLRVRRQVDRVAHRTRLNDVQAILTLSRYLDTHRNGKPLEGATADDMAEWIDALRKPPFGLRDSTASMYAMYVKRFYKWLLSPAEYRKGPQYQKLIPYPECVIWIAAGSSRSSKRRLGADTLLSEVDIRRMVDVCNSPRDKALIMTLWDSGMRLQEAINLNVGSFSKSPQGGDLVLNPDGEEQKTGQRRIFIRDAVPAIIQHLNAHPFKGERGAPLFFTRRAEDYASAIRSSTEDRNLERLRLTRSGVRSILERIARDAGIGKRIFPHLFRHSRATYWAARNVNAATLTHQFGWTASSKTPALYQHLSGAQVDDVLLRAMGVKKDAAEESRPFESQLCPWQHENDPSAIFCASCGTPLDPAKREEHPAVVSADLIAALQNPETAAALAEVLATKWAAGRPKA